MMMVVMIMRVLVMRVVEMFFIRMFGFDKSVRPNRVAQIYNDQISHRRQGCNKKTDGIGCNHRQKQPAPGKSHS